MSLFTVVLVVVALVVLAGVAVFVRAVFVDSTFRGVPRQPREPVTGPPGPRADNHAGAGTWPTAGGFGRGGQWSSH